MQPLSQRRNRDKVEQAVRTAEADAAQPSRDEQALA